jgi:gamma-glutamyltranspeptidase/glutathione hydrolase
MQPKWGIQGMAVAPHSLASQSALAVLREGGNSLEGMIAAGDSCSWQSHGGH